MVKYKSNNNGEILIENETVQIFSEYDVVVVDGGMARCGAGFAAARDGKKTIIIEATSAIGGLATMGLVNIPLDFVSGFGKEMIDGIEKINAHWHRNTNPEKHKLVLDRMAKKYGCEILLEHRRPFIKTCFAGVTEAVIPLFSGEELLAVIMLGQSRDGTYSSEHLSDLIISRVGMSENAVGVYYTFLFVERRCKLKLQRHYITLLMVC